MQEQGQQELNDFLAKIPSVEEENGHWLFRTMGGKLYQPFFYKSIIALDYTNIEEGKVAELLEGDINETKINFVKSKYSDHRRPGLIIANLKRFYNEMKIGDIVLIPNAAGKNLMVGKIVSGVKIIEGIERVKSDGKIYIDHEYRRAREVRWIAAARRRNFSPELYSLLNTHQTISRADSYAEWIDSLLYNIYKKGSQYHYKININQRYGLSAKTVYGVFYELLTTVDEFLKKEHIDETTDNIDTKIVLSSPGYVEFLGVAGKAIAIMCLLILFINGGGFKIRIKDNFSLDLSTNGILRRINEFLNSKQDRKIKERLSEKLASLEIEKSDDIVELLNSINLKNQNDQAN
jgi:hypothetical protein